MKTITLKSNSLGRYDDVSPFIIADGKIEIKVNLPAINGEFFFIAENNEAEFKKVLSGDGRVMLDGLTAGELKAEVKHYLKGNLIQTFKIEPLILQAVDCNLSGTPEIASLRCDADTLVKSLAELKTALEERVKALQSNIAALLRFAYADYKDNIFLAGGSVEEFLKEFGVELSEEESKEIFSKEN